MNNMKAFARLIYIDGFSAAKRYQRLIACYYENYLAFFLCGFQGGNENFAEIRTGWLSGLAASPLDFAIVFGASCPDTVHGVPKILKRKMWQII